MKTDKKATDILDKQLFVFDMDGTIYLGNHVFPYALDFVRHLREAGKRVLFFTNNASRSKEVYVDRLSAMGFTSSSEEIVTSGDVTIQFLLRRRTGKKVYLLGTKALWQSFAASGIPLVNDDAGKWNGETPEIVVSSFDTELTYPKLVCACDFLRNGAEFLSTHPDYNCPVENGFIPDSGSIAALLTASTGKQPKYLGKPYSETIEMLSEVSGIDKEKMCVFGDRLYTDIALGKRNGVLSVLVLSGETTREQVTMLSPEETPDLIFENLGETDRILFAKKSD